MYSTQHILLPSFLVLNTKDPCSPHHILVEIDTLSNSASENGKSAGYVGTTGDGTGIMFLNEVVLGKEVGLRSL